MNDELEAGRALDAAVATALGWQKAVLPWNINHPESSGSDMWYQPDGNIVNPPPVRVHVGVTNLPQFSTEIVHAWMLVEWARGGPYDVDMNIRPAMCEVRFLHRDIEYGTNEAAALWIEDKSAPLAICRAFLKAAV